MSLSRALVFTIHLAPRHHNERARLIRGSEDRRSPEKVFGGSRESRNAERLESVHVKHRYFFLLIKRLIVASSFACTDHHPPQRLAVIIIIKFHCNYYTLPLFQRSSTHLDRLGLPTAKVHRAMMARTSWTSLCLGLIVLVQSESCLFSNCVKVI